MISTRHAQANSPCFPDTYDSSLPKQNLIHLGTNILYDHDHHADYLLTPKSLVIDRSMYSSTQQAEFPESVPQRKLTQFVG